MKIVITGALGHIGSKLIRELPKHFTKLLIAMVDDLSTQRYSSLFHLPNSATYSFLEGKTNVISWKDIIEDATAVVHLSALTDAAGTIDKPETVHENNFESTKALADACLTAGVPLIFPSSTSVYGSQSTLVDENCTELHPQSPYAACKIREENYLKDLFQKGLKGIICRFGTIYGTSPGMRFHTAVNKFCWQAVMGQPVTVWETAIDQKRPYLSLDDCCNAIAWIIQNNLYTNEVYNVASNNWTVRDVINQIKLHIPTLKIKLVRHQIMNQLSYEVSSDKFSKTGFRFTGLLFNGISETLSILKQSNSI